MKSLITIYFFITNILTVTLQCSGQNEMTEIKDFGSNPGNLKMYFHQAKNLNTDSKKIPLVIVLHGCSQTAEIVARESGWNKLADEYGFAVLYPQQLLFNNTGECFNWYNENDISKNKGEVLSIRQMIDYAIRKFQIDTTRIFSYGLSAGAAMSVAMLADYPQLFSAGASLAGAPFMSATNALDGLRAMNNPECKSPEAWGALVKSQNPNYTGKYPRLIIVHGTKDIVVNFKNANELMKQWTNLFGVDTIADSEIKSFQNNENLIRFAWNDKENNEAVIFYQFNNLSHSLPVDPGNGKQQGGETGLFAADKNFFSTYWIAKDFGLISPDISTQEKK